MLATDGTLANQLKARDAKSRSQHRRMMREEAPAAEAPRMRPCLHPSLSTKCRTGLSRSLEAHVDLANRIGTSSACSMICFLRPSDKTEQMSAGISPPKNSLHPSAGSTRTAPRPEAVIEWSSYSQAPSVKMT